MSELETSARTEGDVRRQLVPEVLAIEQVRALAAWIAEHHGEERAAEYLDDVAKRYGQYQAEKARQEKLQAKLDATEDRSGFLAVADEAATALEAAGADTRRLRRYIAQGRVVARQTRSCAVIRPPVARARPRARHERRHVARSTSSGDSGESGEGEPAGHRLAGVLHYKTLGMGVTS